MLFGVLMVTMATMNPPGVVTGGLEVAWGGAGCNVRSLSNECGAALVHGDQVVALLLLYEEALELGSALSAADITDVEVISVPGSDHACCLCLLMALFCFSVMPPCTPAKSPYARAMSKHS